MANLPEIASISPLMVLAGGAAAFVMSFAVSKFAAAVKLLPDHPNTRSSHVKVTSRAGGISIFVGWIVGLAAIGASAGNAEVSRWLFGFGALGALVFGLGLVDDKFTLPALIKLGGQLLAAALFVVFFGPLTSFPAPGAGLMPLGIFAVPVTVLWIVGFMNVFNFMDGINGIAATTAVFILSVFGVIAASLGALAPALAAIALAFAALGFLPANLARGKLFMGDSGSHMISFLIGALAVIVANATAGQLSILFVPAAMAPFFFDVAITIFRRVRRRQNLFTAHREHFYQLLARSGVSHGNVTSIYLLAVIASSMAAIGAVRASASVQWIVLLVIFGMLSIGAAGIYQRALRTGAVDYRAPPVKSSASGIEEDGPASQDDAPPSSNAE